jgi:hypothetical protein
MAERLEVRATFRGGWATDVEARGHEVRIDEPASANGDDSGMMPTEVFLASLAACFCMAVAFAGRKRDLAVPGLQVVVTAQRAGNELRYGRRHPRGARRRHPRPTGRARAALLLGVQHAGRGRGRGVFSYFTERAFPKVNGVQNGTRERGRTGRGP